MDSHKMSKTQLRMLITQRLTAAANEIFEAVERTISEYEEKVNKSNIEINRQRKLLDVMFNPHIQLHRQDYKQRYCEEQSPSLVQEDPGPPQMFDVEVWTSPQELMVQGIKEETCTYDSMVTVPCVQKPPQRDHNLWTGQGQQNLRELEKPDMFPATQAHQIKPVPDEEGRGAPQPPADSNPNIQMGRQRKLHDIVLNPYVRLHREDFQEQHYEQEKNPSLVQKDPEPPQRDHNLWTGHRKPKRQEPEEADMFPFTDQRTPAPNGEGCGEPQSPRDFQPHSEIKTEDSDSKKDLMQDSITLASKKTQILCRGPRCADSTKGRHRNSSLPPRKDTSPSHHVRTDAGEKPYRCSVCGKCFLHIDSVRKHRLIHTEEKPYKCGVCGICFSYINALRDHRRSHTEGRDHTNASFGESASNTPLP